MSLWTSIRDEIFKPFKKVLDWLLPDVSQDRGIIVEKQGTNNPYPIVYGQAFVGAVKIFKLPHNESGGAKNEYLNLICVFCEGEVDEIVEIYFNDIPSSQIDSKRYYIEKFTGADNQPYCSSLGAKVSGWTSTATLDGLCYAYIRLKINKDLDWWQGEPQIKALIKGRKVKDVRTGTTGYSNNPALVLYDYLTNIRFGKGSEESELDIEAFKVAADYCEEGESYTVYEYNHVYDQETGFPLPSAPTETLVTNPRMSCNIALDSANKVLDNVKEIVSGCRGLLIPSENGWKLNIEKGGLPVYSFDSSNIVDDTLDSQAADKNSFYNRVTVRYPSRLILGQYDEVSWPEAGSTTHTDFLSKDKNIPLERSFDFPSINNKAEALQMAEVVCRRSRESRQVQLVGQPWTIVVEVGDIVDITDSTHGWVNKAFRVLDKTINTDATVAFVFIEHQDNIYPWSVNEVNEYYADTSLAAPHNLPAPSGLSYAETPDDAVYQGVISWDDANDVLVTRYTLEFWQDGSLVESVDITDNYLQLSVTPIGDYSLKLRAKNSLYESPESTLSISVTVEPKAAAGGLVLYASEQIFTESATGELTPDAIVFNAQTDSDEPIQWITTPSVPLSGTGKTRILSKDDIGEHNYITVSASISNALDKVSVFRITEGTNGITGLLTNESHVIAADADGNLIGSLNAAGGSFLVYLGVDNITADCTFTVTSESGLSATINSTTGTYTITALTADTGTATFTATLGELVISKVYTIAKALSGSAGQNGQDGAAGQDGVPGEDGAAGQDGADGLRGSKHFYRAITGSSWSDVEAFAAITADGLTAILRDIVTLYNNTEGYSETRFYDGTDWLTVAQVIDGNLLVDGTIGAAKLIVDEIFAQHVTASGSITAGTGGTTATLSGGNDPLSVHVGGQRVFGISGDKIYFDGAIASGSVKTLDIFPAHIQAQIINSNVSLGTESTGGSANLTNQALSGTSTTSKTLTVSPCNDNSATIGFTLRDFQGRSTTPLTAPVWNVTIRRNNAIGTVIYNQNHTGSIVQDTEFSPSRYDLFFDATDSISDSGHGKVSGDTLTYVVQVSKVSGSHNSPIAEAISLDQGRIGGIGGGTVTYSSGALADLIRKPRNLYKSLFDQAVGTSSYKVIEIGDSLAYRYNSCWLPALDRMLGGTNNEDINTVGTIAAGGVYSAGGDLSYSTLINAVSLSDQYDYWINGNVLDISAGGSATLVYGGVSPSFDELQIYFVKEPSAGSIEIEVDGLQVAAQDADNGTIDCAVLKYAQAYKKSDIVIRASGGNVKVLFAHITSNQSGVDYYSAFEKGGLLLKDAYVADSTKRIFEFVLADIAPNMITYEMDDDVVDTDGLAAFEALAGSINSTVYYADKLFYTALPRASEDELAQQNADVVRQFVEQQNNTWLYFDSYAALGNYAEMTEIFGEGDGVHPTPAMNNFIGSLIMQSLDLDSSILGYSPQAINAISKASRLKQGTSFVGADNNTLVLDTDQVFGLDWELQTPRVFSVFEKMFGTTLFQLANGITGIPNILPESMYLGSPDNDGDGIYYKVTGGAGYVKRMSLLDSRETGNIAGVEAMIQPMPITKADLVSGKFPANGLKGSMVRVTDSNQGDAVFLAFGDYPEDWRQVVTDRNINEDAGSDIARLNVEQVYSRKVTFTDPGNVFNTINRYNAASTVGKASAPFFEVYAVKGLFNGIEVGYITLNGSDISNTYASKDFVSTYYATKSYVQSNFATDSQVTDLDQEVADLKARIEALEALHANSGS